MPNEKPVLSIKKRRRRNRDEIIEDIIRIARGMMLADGVAALSFNAIARQLGIKPPSLYTYFDSKNAIYDELFQRGWALFIEQSEQVMAQECGLREKLVLTFAGYMRFAQENPDYYQIMFARPVPDFVPSEESLTISFSALDEFTEYLQELLEREQVDPGMAYPQARDILIALMHGLTEQHLANNPELPVGEGRYGGLIEQAVDTILRAWSVAH